MEIEPLKERSVKTQSSGRFKYTCPEQNSSDEVREEKPICKDDGPFVSTGRCYTFLLKCRH